MLKTYCECPVCNSKHARRVARREWMRVIPLKLRRWRCLDCNTSYLTVLHNGPSADSDEAG